MVRVSKEVKKNAKLNSFQTPIKIKILVATNPPEIKGNVIRVKATNLLHPSTQAASSISMGTATINPRNIQME